jgi:hypothetical protein
MKYKKRGMKEIKKNKVIEKKKENRKDISLRQALPA